MCSRWRRTSASRRAPGRGRRPPPSQQPRPPRVDAARWTRFRRGPHPRPLTRQVPTRPAGSPLCVAAPGKKPTGLPNCSRVRMYSVAASAQWRTAPAAAHAARPTTRQRARSVGMPDISALSGTTWSANSTTPTSVHRSVPCCDSIVTTRARRDHKPSQAAIRGTGRKQNTLRCTDSQHRVRRSVEPPGVSFGDGLDVAVLGQHDDRRRPGGQISQQRLD